MRAIETARSWRSSCPPEQVWGAIVDTAAYRSWWPWLERLDAGRFETGGSLTSTIRAPAGYRVRYVVRFTEVERPRRISAIIEGDLGGWARIILQPDGAGTVLRFRSSLHPRRPLLQLGGIVAESVMVAGHDLILDRGATQFAAGAGVDLTPVGGTRDHRRTGEDVARAALVAGVLSGGPSTAHAALTGGDVLAASRAAGALLGRETVPRGLLAHAVMSLGWTSVLAATLPRRGSISAGALAGAAIAALDLGLVGRRIPAIRALPLLPQVADHVAFGALVGATIDRSGRPDR